MTLQKKVIKGKKEKKGGGGRFLKSALLSNLSKEVMAS